MPRMIYLELHSSRLLHVVLLINLVMITPTCLQQAFVHKEVVMGPIEHACKPFITDTGMW